MSEADKPVEAAAAATTGEKKSFIVTLKESASVEKFKEGLHKIGGEITHEYNLIKGFAVKLPSFHASTLKKDDQVATVEEDKEVNIQQ